jgi:hypothetical protein
VLHDPDARALHRLGLGSADTAIYLIRPDGRVGYRSGIQNPDALQRYLDRWLPPPSP